jgi:iron complex transport system permease protein
MTQAVIQARQGLLLTTSTILALVLLVLVTAIGVSVGEPFIPLSSVLMHSPTDLA